MSASLIVLIPVVLLGLVTALCFVGCVLNTHGFGFGPYEDAVRADKNLVACWPLDDGPSTDTSAPKAFDLSTNQLNGTYTNVPGGFQYDPVILSAAAPGTFSLQQPGLVPNDVQLNVKTPCASFNGGFVQVPFNALLNQGQFTVECWVQPDWDAGDPPANRGIVVSAGTTGIGWALTATPDNFWAANIGVGGSFLVVKSNQPIALGANNNTPVFLAMTFDGSTLTLFVGPVGAPALDMTAGPPNAGYQPVTSMTPMRLFIAMGRADMTNGLLPFNGSIQDVAYYGTAYDTQTMNAHFMLGNPG